jgi:fructose-bisphosphate aldolase, class II
MPLARPDQYAAMLDAAAHGGFAYPAVNVTSSQTLNAALDGFAAAGSDGIVQVTVGGAGVVALGTDYNILMTDRTAARGDARRPAGP